MMKQIAVHLADGFEEIEAVTIIDILRRAGMEVTTISVTGRKEVTGAHKLTVIADSLFEENAYESMDMIVLPGGMPGATNLSKHEGLRKQILKFNNQGKPLGAICAAPLVLGQLGILKGRAATCYPGFDIQLTGATVTGKNIEVSGHIITGKGAGVAMEFALKIVEMFKGKPIADELGKKMIFEF